MLKQYRGTMTRRFMAGVDFRGIESSDKSTKALREILPKRSGRDQSGHVSMRHQGGREKRFYRFVDFKRDKFGVEGTVMAIEYDPNRTANLALINYPDGEKRYILEPEGIKIGDKIMSAKTGIDARLGNTMEIGTMPIGTVVHNIELQPGAGGIIVRGAGGSATILAREGEYVTIKLPSGETRLVKATCLATVGTIGNIDWKNTVLGKAGKSRHRGIRPTVRGTAQNPRTHPHGGGEGRSGEGMNPKTPWGKSARGTKTRKGNKYSDRFILDRKKKKNN